MDTLFSQADDSPADSAEASGADTRPDALADQGAIPLHEVHEPLVESEVSSAEENSPLAPSRALAISDYVAPATSFGERLVRFAYRLGVPGAVIEKPFRKPAGLRLLGTVETPLVGDRSAGMALRAGHFLICGVKAPIKTFDFSSAVRQSDAFHRAIHSFGWLRDLAASAPRAQCLALAEEITAKWLDANDEPGEGTGWEIGHTARRLRAWLVHAPLVLSGDNPQLRPRVLAAIASHARWLDSAVRRSAPGSDSAAAWAAITAAGLLLPGGKPRRIYGEAGLIKALGELVTQDGGVVSRSPSAQIDAIALLIDLRACYAAVSREMPEALAVMLELLVPPLLSLRHGDGGLGCWQGSGAIGADRLAALIDASGVRARPLKQTMDWGYHRLRGGRTTVQIDAAPPPRARDADHGCASTLAFEMSDGPHRLIVNCGGASLAGGLVPALIEKGLRATAAHSTLVLDNSNSTAVLLGGKLGKGVETVEVDRCELGATAKSPEDGGARIEASHDGYASRHGLVHKRVLILRGNGGELHGEDVLEPKGRKGKRGKIGYALRFHLGPEVEARLADDHSGANLVLPDGSLWEFRFAREDDAADIALEESLWVDGEGRPHPTRQLVIEGMTMRSGGRFSWLFKKMR